MNLVVVETPAQAKVLSAILGEGWRVEPCYGMVRDLAEGELGVDVDNDFHPTFVVTSGKGQIVRRFMKAVRGCDAVYAATPPGRVGEVMAWHVLALSPDTREKPIYRVSLPALTSEAVRVAFAALRPLDTNVVDAELAHRLVDRLAGYTVNVAAREREDHQAVSRTAMIALCCLAAWNAASPQPDHKRWKVTVRVTVDSTEVAATLCHTDGGHVTFSTEENARAVAEGLRAAQYWVAKAGIRAREVPAPASYTLATLLVDAEYRFGMAPATTLTLLNALYDAGWITHPLTSYPHELCDTARSYLRREFGSDYAITTASKARNGISPADVTRLPEDLPGDGAALYGLIWRRFMAAQLPSARLRQSGVLIAAGARRTRPYPLCLRSVGTLVAFDGWLRVLPDEQPQTDAYLPVVREGDTAQFISAEIEPLSLSAPKSLTAAGLIAQHGSTRPALWSAALEELDSAGYIRSSDQTLALTGSGAWFAAWLTERFPSVVSESAVLQLDLELDRVAVGQRGRVEVVRTFWEQLSADVHALTATPAAEGVRASIEHKPVVLRPVEEV